MPQKSSIIALIGCPNAGKSTLLNVLVGQKIAIVTPKVQTTRHNTRGILSTGEAQLVFVDTPGLFKPRRKLEQWITSAAWQGIKQADSICLILDSKNADFEHIDSIKEKIVGSKKQCLLVLNKVDLVRDKKDLLPIVDKAKAMGIFQQIFMVSALRGDGIKELVDLLAADASNKPWMFEEDALTDRTEREIAEEITRETLYMSLAEELPYSLEVKTELWQEQSDGSTKIYQVIHILKESQKAILLGKQGGKIKEIGSKARQEIAQMLGRDAHLFLHVKVKEDWIEQLKIKE